MIKGIGFLQTRNLRYWLPNFKIYATEKFDPDQFFSLEGHWKVIAALG